MNHVMIDLETLGTEKGSVFLTLAAVQFDLQSEKTGKDFKINIDLTSALEAGLTVSGSTIKWWLTQRPEIMKKMFEGECFTLDVALAKFSMWWQENNLTSPWGNSAAFDLGLLAAGYQKVHLPIPWAYYNERCYRTMHSMFKDLCSYMQPPVDAHDPLVDCYHQIGKLQAIYRALTSKV